MNLTSLMKEYLNESTQSDIQRSLFGQLDKEYPVEIEPKPIWEKLENPERLKRKFAFDYPKQLIQFIFEVMHYEMEVHHNASILIEGLNATVEVYTHDVDAITEIDIEYSEELNKIYKDVKEYEQAGDR